MLGGNVNYDQLIDRLSSAGGPRTFQYGEVVEAGRTWPLLGIRTEGRRELVITSGFHGEEPAGPITLARHLPEILEIADRAGVGLRIYPCVNPSGFEARHRYNASGEKPNNDFLRYETSPGVWKGELYPGDTSLRWVLYDGGPKETRAIRAELERGGVPDAALDIHQDFHLPDAVAYAYVFGERARFLPLVAATGKLIRIARNAKVDERLASDADGLIEFNDGSVTDYYLRRGTPFTAALETTTRTPLEVCEQVNLVWIKGFIELAKG